MGWLKGLLGMERMIPYRLCEEDRQLIEGLQLHLASLFEESQALAMEMSATRVILETINENLVAKDAPAGRAHQKGKGRTHRPPNGKDNQRQGKGEV